MTPAGKRPNNPASLGTAPWGKIGGSNHRRLPARMLRRDFKVAKEVRRATAYVCGLGFFDLHVNGRLIGDQLMNPALTGYDRRALYVTFDVTRDVHPGDNAVGVVLGNGRYFAPRTRHSRADDDLRISQAALPAPSGVSRRLGRERGQRRRLAADDRRPHPIEQRIRRRGIRRPARDAGLVAARL